jgi:hypothetical protein
MMLLLKFAPWNSKKETGTATATNIAHS